MSRLANLWAGRLPLAEAFWTWSVAGVLVGALADPAASLVGARFGARTGKSLVGSGAFVVVAFAILLSLGMSIGTVLAAGVLGAVAERWPGRLDDNLLIAPVVALVVTASS